MTERRRAHGRGEPVLSIRDLRVTFRTDDGTVSAVDGVSFDVAPGEVLGVVGESGCGKSVTAMSIAGLLPATASVTGSVRLRGRELVGAPEPVLREVRGNEVAYIFQEPMTSLNPVFTVGSQIAETLRIHQGMSRRAAVDRAVELLALVDIPEPARRVREYPHQFSGGMRQRVMIAMALACDPAVLVADEPTTALDVTVQAAVLDLLRDLGSRLHTAIVLITHDLGVVADIADRVLVMYAGRPVETAPTQELFDHPRHHYTLGLLGAVPTSARRGAGNRLREIPGLVPVLHEQPDACTFAERCSAADEQCTSAAPALVPVTGDKGGVGIDTHRAACWHPADER
jgi:peptide/nickel transport system ATP-binding protein